MTSKNITFQLSDLISNLRYDDLTIIEKEDLKYKILDWMGCAIGGSSKKTGINTIKLFETFGGNRESTIIGSRLKVHHANAAYSNGILGHILELDDVHKASISHPGAIAIPSAMAVSEAENSKIEDFLMGIVAGYETMIRLGTALNPSHYESWHTTGTCGSFASAAAAARVKGFSTEQTNVSLNIVTTTASGLVSVFGTDAKLVTIGHACHSGIMASLFAENGFSGTADGIGMKKGYGELTSSEHDLEKKFNSQPNPLQLNTSSYKIHASCGHTHSSIDGVLSLLKEENLEIDDIIKIEIGTYEVAVKLTGEFNNEDEQKAKFSLPYCISCALIFGEVSLKQFDYEVLNSLSICELSNKIHVYNDKKCTELYPEKRMAIVKVFLEGKVLEKVVPLPFGQPDKTFIKDKFLSLATMATTESKAENIMKQILSIDQFYNMNEFVYSLKM